MKSAASTLKFLSKTILSCVACWWLLTVLLETPTPVCLVRGRSMLPALQPGDLILVSNRSDRAVREGDIVVFRPEDSVGQIVVHRVVRVRNGGLRMLTRGDNNRKVDPQWTRRSALAGVLVLRIPYIGRLKPV